VDGFESGLIGAEIGGDPVVVNVTFPEDYALNPELAGKPAEFTVTVHSKQVTTVPELDMDFIKAQGSEAASIDEYKEAVRAEITVQKEQEAIDEQKAYLWNKLVESTEQKTGEDGEPLYPEEELDRVTNEFKEEYQTYADQYGMEYGEFIEQQTGMSEEEFDAQIKEYAKSVVLQEMILYYMVDKEDIKISKDEYENYIKEQLDDMGMDEDSFEQAYGQSFEDYMTEDVIRRTIYLDKVTSLMLENAVQVDELSEPAAEGEDAGTDAAEETEAEDGE
jgi:trigger factor